MLQALQRRNQTLEEQLRNALYTSSVLASAQNDRAEKLMEAWAKDRADRERAYMQEAEARDVTCDMDCTAAVELLPDVRRTMDASTITSDFFESGDAEADRSVLQPHTQKNCTAAPVSGTASGDGCDSHEADLLNEAQELMTRLPEETTLSLLAMLHQSHTPVARRVRHLALAAAKGPSEEESMDQETGVSVDQGGQYRESHACRSTATAVTAAGPPRERKGGQGRRKGAEKGEIKSQGWQPGIPTLEEIIALDSPGDTPVKHLTTTQIVASFSGLLLLSAICSSVQEFTVWLASLQVFGIFVSSLWWEEDQVSGRGCRILAQMMVLLVSGSIGGLLVWIGGACPFPLLTARLLACLSCFSGL